MLSCLDWSLSVRPGQSPPTRQHSQRKNVPIVGYHDDNYLSVAPITCQLCLLWHTIIGHACFRLQFLDSIQNGGYVRWVIIKLQFILTYFDWIEIQISTRLAAPWDNINFRFHFCNEVVYPKDHDFIFFRIFRFLKIFFINISMKPLKTQTNFLYTWTLAKGRLNVPTALGHMVMPSAQRWADNQCCGCITSCPGYKTPIRH